MPRSGSAFSRTRADFGDNSREWMLTVFFIRSWRAAHWQLKYQPQNRIVCAANVQSGLRELHSIKKESFHAG
jgi:hypothetical protein